MATLATTHPTLLDVTKRTDPMGKIDRIAEYLNQVNPILDDGVWIEANQVASHRTTIRTGLPSLTWRKLYGGVQPSKSTTTQVTDSIGMLEAVAEVDAALAELNNNAAEFRYSEELAFQEAMAQELSSKTFNANEGTQPETFNGLKVRFNDRNALNAENLLNASATINGGPGSANNGLTRCWSIFLVGWGPNTCHYIYPKGSKAGLQYTDLGRVMTENIDGANGRAMIYRSHYRWDCGLSLRDWRYVVRIHGIDSTTLTKSSASGADLIDLMSQATFLPPSLAAARFVFYVNRSVLSFLSRQISNKIAASTLTWEMVGGKRVMMFMGIPVKQTDALAPLETKVGTD